MTSQIAAINPLSAYPGRPGHINTCMNLIKSLVAEGANASLHAQRIMVESGQISLYTGVPNALARLHQPVMERFFTRRLYRMYRNHVQAGTICWIWPATEVALVRELAGRGLPIVVENINSRMAYARDILDAAYAEAGLPPSHGITDEGIRAEEEILQLATHAFAPSPMVSESLRAADSPFRGHIIKAGYGMWRPSDAELAQLRSRCGTRKRPVFACVGSLCIRKGTHHLLRAWSEASPDATLILHGPIHSEIAELCRAELARPDVQAFGMTRDMETAYGSADVYVLPSLEDGGPQTTFEAASYGLPLLVTSAGAGRLTEMPEAVRLIDGYDIKKFAEAIRELAEDAAQRQKLGAAARAASVAFGWRALAAERLTGLRETIPEAGRF